MKKNIILLFILFSFPVFLFAQTNRINGELIVQLYKTQSIYDVIKNINPDNDFNLKINKPISARLNIWLLNFNDNEINSQKIINTFIHQSSVANVQFNHLAKQRALPNDPLYDSQWNMYNDGTSGGTADADIDADLAWDITTGGLTADGDTIVVAVVGEGVDLNHEDLNFWKNYNEIPNNLIDDDENGYVDDYDGWNSEVMTDSLPEYNHGTHVSGIIGAKGNNGIGVTGVNWNVKILPLYNDFTEANIIASYAYVFTMRELYDQTNGEKGAFIISTNSSFGIDFGQPDEYPLWCAMYDSLGSLGILNAGATANMDTNIDVVGDMPTGCPSDYLITVTNTDNTDNLYVAAYGATTIDLSAPGTLINSTLTDNTYGKLTGTSMATPHVAGAVALLMAAACEKFIKDYKFNPPAMAILLKQFILTGVDPVPDLNGVTVSNGRLNLFNSINNLNSGYCADNVLNNVNNILNFNLYPNPANAFIYFNLSNSSVKNISVTIYDIMGKQILIFPQINYGKLINGIDINNFPDGFYVLRITGETNSDYYSSTFVVQHN